ncbi:MAG: PKD domain-containing protein, partial [Candidatus Omnitrophica bacterium]|nr:PKD domain-containing protein [Candidatus Omnitrophota bacterium]
PLFIQKPNCWLWYLPIAPVVITDVDNNGIVDLVVSSTCVETWDLENEFSIMSKCRGEIYIWELGTSFNAEQSFWPAGQHDFCNTGRYNGSDDGYINRSPVLDPIEDKEVDAGTRLSFIVSASDPDGDKVFIKGAKMLDGSSISTIGAELICDLEGITRFNWTPTVEQAGKNYYVCFEAVDDKRVVSEPLTVKIEVKINHIPYFSAIGNKTIDEGELLEFTVSANDCDGDELTYTVRDLPQGAVFKGQNFKWIPTYDQAGVYNMLFIVDDNKGGKNIEAITISVHNKVNTPPKIFFMFCSQEQEVEVGQLLEFIVVGKDAENDVFHIAATIPEEITNATFVQKANALGGVFRWKPTNAHAGKSYCISFDAVDRHYARSNTLIAEINVKAVNKPPVFTAVPAEHYQVKPGQSLNFPVSVYDSDGDTIMLSAKVVDGEQLISLDSIGAKFIGSSLGTNGYNTKTFIWTPKVEHGGNEYSVVFESNDDRGGRVSKTVTFAVIPSRAEIYSIELDAKDTRKCIIKGGDFGERNEHSIVYFGIYGEIVSWSDKEIVCILPEKIINQKIIYLCVHTRGGWSEWKSFSYRVSKEIKISHVSVKEVEKGQNLTLQVKVDNPQNVRYLKVRYKYYKEFNWRNRSWKYWSYGRRYVYNKNPDDKTIYTATIPCSRVVEGKGNVKYYIYGRDKSGKTHQIEWISTDVN